MSLVPKLPNVQLPTIANLPTIPGVGCVSGSATIYHGTQFGGLPSLQSVLHIKALKKQYEDMMQTLIEGYVPAALRAPVWAVRVANYTAYVASLVAEAEALINNMAAEISASIMFIDSKISELNAAKTLILNMPANARSKVQVAMLQRYNRYLGELERQSARLQSTLSCIGIF
ncbi:MAG: hypothetical protein AUG51_07375 [Acidobacteria bacterium 13_1_20CM_3_53_8]|nr:MAG: hypothetical protein AUG51_07375 [Acidobacteria bacterium 13_1_20CM_3_53_8]